MWGYGYTVDELDGRESVVRVDAGRLRRKLEEYYGDVGKGDEVRLSLPKGGYTPTFEQTAQSVVETAGDVAQQEPSNVKRWFVGAVVAAAVVVGSGVFLVQKTLGASRPGLGSILRMEMWKTRDGSQHSPSD